MNSAMRVHLLVFTLWLAASSASADRLVLKDGAVLEGHVTELADKVIIAVESGEISFARSAVARVERGETELDRFVARLASAKTADVPVLLKLADQCRDKALPAREREVLRRILELEPNHEAARTRLGYVKTTAGWVTRDEERRRAGLVQFDGQWVSRAEKLELERLATQTKIAALERDKAALEVEAKRVALETQKQAAQAPAAAPPVTQVVVPWYAPAGCDARSCVTLPPAPYPATPMILNGVRDPRDMSFSLPGVRDPRSYF
jgi:hypothetical protein